MGTGVRVDPDSILPYSISLSHTHTHCDCLCLSLSRKHTLASADSNLWNSTAVAHAARTHRENPRAAALFWSEAISPYGRRARSRILCLARRAHAASRKSLDSPGTGHRRKKVAPAEGSAERAIIFEVPALASAHEAGFLQAHKKRSPLICGM